MPDYEIERELLENSYHAVCGVDEVGRGALFGPVVSGAVILDPRKLDYRIKDSKKLSPGSRVRLAKVIYRTARAYAIGWCWNEDIDEMNILEATRVSMIRALAGLQIPPDYVLIDGMRPDFVNIPGAGLNKGDNRSLSIAAASIIAKVFRDQMMCSFSRYFPDYGLESNMGYPTRKHAQALAEHGISTFHRLSFRTVKWQLKKD